LTWAALGSGMDWPVSALTTYNGELIAGGGFTQPASRIARWNGSSWSALGAGVNNTVYALAEYGGDLIAGGDFTMAGGQDANHVAKWDGTAWSALDAGTNGSVGTLIVYGGDLLAGGAFTTAGRAVANHVARWGGSTWGGVGSGMNGDVNDLTIWDSNLIAGGAFTQAEGQSANRAAHWQDCAGGQVTLAIVASCPSGGPIQVSWSGATPNGQIALIFARNQGSFIIPNNYPCAGTQLGLDSNQIQLVFQGGAGKNGSRTLNAAAGPNACGGHLQLLDLATCGTSNTARIE